MISRREKFIATRPPMTHEDFLLALQVPVSPVGWIVVVREAMGHFLKLPAFAIYPMDTWQTLEPFFPLDGWDEMGFILSLEAVGVEFLDDESQTLPRFIEGRFFWLRWRGSANIGEWSVRVAMHLISKNCNLKLRSINNDSFSS